jgi:Fur family peroxide stress response transcriptional regulator
LQELNFITVLEFNEMENRYEGDTSHHWNLVCLNCRKIFDYRPDHIIDREQIKTTTRFEVFRSRFELHGLCHDCAGTKRKHSGKRGKQIQIMSSSREG